MSALISSLKDLESKLEALNVARGVYSALVKENNILNEDDKNYLKIYTENINEKLSALQPLETLEVLFGDGAAAKVARDSSGLMLPDDGSSNSKAVNPGRKKNRKAGRDALYDALYYGAVYQSKFRSDVTIDKIFNVLNAYNDKRLFVTFKSIMSRCCNDREHFSRDKDDFYSITPDGELHLKKLLTKIYNKKPADKEEIRRRLIEEFGENFIELP